MTRKASKKETRKPAQRGFSLGDLDGKLAGGI